MIGNPRSLDTRLLGARLAYQPDATWQISAELYPLLDEGGEVGSEFSPWGGEPRGRDGGDADPIGLRSVYPITLSRRGDRALLSGASRASDGA